MKNRSHQSALSEQTPNSVQDKYSKDQSERKDRMEK